MKEAGQGGSPDVRMGPRDHQNESSVVHKHPANQVGAEGARMPGNQCVAAVHEDESTHARPNAAVAWKGGQEL